jgi:hypothetical protein
MTKIQQLIKYANDNYEAGGHWLVECWGCAEYNEVLEKAGGNLEVAKDALKREWEFTNEQAQNCAW